MKKEYECTRCVFYKCTYVCDVKIPHPPEPYNCPLNLDIAKWNKKD